MSVRLLIAVLAVSLLCAAPASAQEAWVEPEWFGPAAPDAPIFEVPRVFAPTVAEAPTLPGDVALVRPDGTAVAPKGAPATVRAIIRAANRIVGKPYKWGGGHARLEDRGYDCSGAVGYALIKAGFLRSPQVSGQFARWALPGAGRWVTIYANRGHVYMDVAGLRLDTSAIGDLNRAKGPRWRAVIGARPGFKVRHIPDL